MGVGFKRCHFKGHKLLGRRVFYDLALQSDEHHKQEDKVKFIKKNTFFRLLW
jgi:hypothetical protein